ncbi:MAG: histidine phosphatase family protein [Candidatus Pacebacteria bacterium]|nr:histidine phosphatase family protein [Candidatus Paceibacterota bacterium]
MRVHLIRHGETELNQKHIHQPAQSELSAVGQKQARALAPVLESLEVDLVLSSDLARARQTAEIATHTLDVPITYTDTLRELRRPSALFGTSHFRPKTVRYVLQSLKHRTDPQWHFEDGESIFEVRKRAEDVVAQLEQLSRKRKNRPTSIAVFSHALFIEILRGALCSIGPRKWLDYIPIFSPFSRVPNTAVTTLFYDDDAKPGTCDWELVRENDVSHIV